MLNKYFNDGRLSQEQRIMQRLSMNFIDLLTGGRMLESSHLPTPSPVGRGYRLDSQKSYGSVLQSGIASAVLQLVEFSDSKSGGHCVPFSSCLLGGIPRLRFSQCRGSLGVRKKSSWTKTKRVVNLRTRKCSSSYHVWIPGWRG